MNKFETLNGVLPVAPIKISGKYKVVVDINGNLYLDDFLGRRVVVDINNEFLPQVANFLSTSTTEPDSNYLKHGCNEYSKQKRYLLPLYLGDINNYPKYFVIHDSYKNIIDFKNLDSIGLTKIFTEINNKFDYPIVSNFEEGKLDLYGYCIDSLSKRPYSYNINELLANQNKIENTNNNILNLYVKNNMFYPKFINIEFEFDYVDIDNNFVFEKFTGYLSYGTEVTEETFDEDKLNVIISDKWKQSLSFNKFVYDEFIGTTTVTNVANKLAEVRFRLRTLSVGDEVVINIGDEVDFSYSVKASDVKGKLYETVTRFCNSATRASYNNYIFSIAKHHTDYIEISIINNDNNEEPELIIPNKFNYINGQKHFRSITDYDLKIYNVDELNVDVIKIKGRERIVDEIFTFDSYTYIRLIDVIDIDQGESESIFLYSLKSSKVLELNPIEYLTVDDDLVAEKQYNINEYIKELKDVFLINRQDVDNDNFDVMYNASLEAITLFEESVIEYDREPYVMDIESDNNRKETISTNIVTQTNKLEDKVLKIMFASSGQTSYLTPNVLNYDKRFWETSANVNPLKVDQDYMKFNWFLIKSKTPDYLKDSVAGLRYFTDEPKITSRLVNYTGTSYCESVFLGVRYILPVKYKNYNFAVYLDFDTDLELSYRFNINHIDKTIYLVIYKFIDFIDLIRGGNINNDALFDLSLLYNAQSSFNSMSDALYSFKTGGILFCDNVLPVMFEGSTTKNWKVYESTTNKWYICLKRSRTVITDDFTNIFPSQGDSEFYVYSSFVDEYGDEHFYISVKFKVKNIRTLNSDYLWCEDVEAEFYDMSKMFVLDDDNKMYRVRESNIFTNTPLRGKLFSDYESTMVTTILTDSGNQKFKVFNFDKTISFKQYYFEVTRHVEYKNNGSKDITDTYFTFPECVYPTSANSQMLDTLMTNFERGDTFDNTSYEVTLDLFHRNQVWNLLRELINVDIRFKHTLLSQTRRIINNLLVSNLIERADLSSIQSNIPDESVSLIVNQLDSNVVIWKDYILSNNAPKINQIYRHSGIYLPHLKSTDKFEDVEFLNNVRDFTLITDWTKELNYFDLVDNNVTGIDTDLLLNRYYKIKYICNEYNQRLDYFINADNEFILSFNDLTTYHERFNKLYLTFERK